MRPNAYGGIVDHSLRLAALASAAVPGLDPISVQEIVLGDDEPFDVAFIQDSRQRRWVIRAPRTEVAAARMDASLAMLGLLSRRVPFAVPAAEGFAPIEHIGRAAVHSYIPGNPLDFAALHPAHPVTAELGRTIAMIHNVERALFDEAGLPSYEAEEYRQRHLAEIDRGAATGRVPAGLLARWEEALDDVRLWRFAPTPIHGSLDGSAFLVTFPDPKDATRATIRGVTGWEAAQIADPADDFAGLVGRTRSEVVDAVFAAYSQVRVERPDDHVLARARLVSELQMLAQLLNAVAARDEVSTEALTARLRRLDDAVHDERQSRRLQIVPTAPATASASSSAATSTSSQTAKSATESPADSPPRGLRWGRQEPAVSAPSPATPADSQHTEPSAENADHDDDAAWEVGPDGDDGNDDDAPDVDATDVDATDVIETVPPGDDDDHDEDESPDDDPAAESSDDDGSEHAESADDTDAGAGSGAGSGTGARTGSPDGVEDGDDVIERG